MVIYIRILVYGAGVLGCNLAHALWISHKDVTLLARGNKKQWNDDSAQIVCR